MMRAELFETFEHRHLLILLAIIPFLIVWHLIRRKKQYSWYELPSVDFFGIDIKTWRVKFKWLIHFFRFLALAFIIWALARPVSESQRHDTTTEGIDIVFAIDISSSMLARDFSPNRLEAVKEISTEFINARPNDRFGLVAFAGLSFTLCPLTIDYILVKEQIMSLKTGMTEDGTAIGDGLATAINRLRESEAKSKVVILLTDGENNRGFIDPITAADIAGTLGIRVYTIGAGTIGKAYQPVAIAPNGSYIYDYADVRIDYELLNSIAEMTNAKSFKATDKQALREIWKEIDQLEKTRIDVSVFKRKHEEYAILLWIALILLGFEFLSKIFIFRTLP